MSYDVALDPSDAHDPLLERVAALRAAREHGVAEALLREELGRLSPTGWRVFELERELASLLESRGEWSEAEAVLRKALDARAGLDAGHREVREARAALDLLEQARDDGDERTVIKPAEAPNGAATPVIAAERVAAPPTSPARARWPVAVGAALAALGAVAWWLAS